MVLYKMWEKFIIFQRNTCKGEKLWSKRNKLIKVNIEEKIKDHYFWEIMCTIFHIPLLSCHTRHFDISPILSMSLCVNTSSWSFSNGLLLVSDFFRWSSPVSPFEPKRMTYTLASVPAPGTLEVFTEILYVVPGNKIGELIMKV